MEREFLQQCVTEGLTLREIGERTGKHLTTVGYWMKRHGLRTAGSTKFRPKKSQISRERLEQLVEDGASLRDLSEILGLSISTVRHWLSKYELKTSPYGWQRSQTRMAREAGLTLIERNCSHHGPTTFILEGRGYYRCAKCRSAAVARWRRRAKRRLIETAGGSCVRCGYADYPGALHFHHLDPKQKRYVISRCGHTRSFAEALAEAQKCVLLCANCHAEVEGGVSKVPPANDADDKLS